MGDGGDVVIRAESVQLPAISFTWDGTKEDAEEIVAFLQRAIPADDILSAHYRASTAHGPDLTIWLADLSEMGTTIYLKPGRSAAVVVHPEDGSPLWVMHGDVPQEMIVLQESHRAIGG